MAEHLQRKVEAALGAAESRAARLERARVSIDRDPVEHRKVKAGQRLADRWCEEHAADVLSTTAAAVGLAPRCWPDLAAPPSLLATALARADAALAVPAPQPVAVMAALEDLHAHLSPQLREPPAPAPGWEIEREGLRAEIAELIEQRARAAAVSSDRGHTPA